MTSASPKFLQDLRSNLAKHFSLNELRELAFVLNVAWDDLPGSNQSLKCQSLINRLVLSGSIANLLILVHEERPGVTWHPVLSAQPMVQQARDPFPDDLREDAFLEYVNEVSTLLRDHNLWASGTAEHVRAMFRQKTLAAFEKLEGEMKGKLLRWLHDAKIIGQEAMVDPQGAHLDRAEARGADLSGANLSGANLSRADLSQANLAGANLRKAIMGGADLCRVNLSQADLYAAHLWGSNLRQANLYRANLTSARLSDADLWGADLREANLNEAHLWGANLETANLEAARHLTSEQLAMAKSIKGAVLPDGTTAR